MWQSILILLILAAVIIYVIRHYAKMSRSSTPFCSGCTGCGAPVQERNKK